MVKNSSYHIPGAWISLKYQSFLNLTEGTRGRVPFFNKMFVCTQDVMFNLL